MLPSTKHRQEETLLRSLESQVRPIFERRPDLRPTSHQSLYNRRTSLNFFAKVRVTKTIELQKETLKPVIFEFQLSDGAFQSIKPPDRQVYLRPASQEPTQLAKPTYQPLLQCNQMKLSPMKSLMSTVIPRSGSKFNNYNLEATEDPIEECQMLPLTQSRKEKIHRNLVFANNDGSYKFYVGLGNNRDLVERVLLKRQRFSASSESNSMINLRWTQTTQNTKFNTITSSNGCKQVVNHFEGHEEISTKSGLLRNLKTKCERDQNQSLFQLTPITFQVDFNSDGCDEQLKRFVHFFIQHSPQRESSLKSRKKEEYKEYMEFVKKLKPIHTLQNTSYDRRQHPFSKPLLKDVYSAGESSYLWLLKPTSFNRGRGIYIFEDLDELLGILQEYFEIIPDAKSRTRELPSRGKCEGDPTTRQKKCVRASSFVIQKYIEKPLLIDKRKFDIRVWALVTQSMDLYFFKQGYVRTSCKEFQIANKDLYIHLTNNAIQKNSEEYGQFQDGNQLSFKDMELQLQKLQPNQDQDPGHKAVSFNSHLLPELKRQVSFSMESVAKKLNPSNRKHSFQIFGYDFMVDINYKVWLIEVNTNPCIEESSPLLQKLLPRMLDDAFVLTIDQVFRIKTKGPPFPVDGYSDTESMWQKLPLSPRSPSKR